MEMLISFGRNMRSIQYLFLCQNQLFNSQISLIDVLGICPLTILAHEPTS